jgi:hypothetical protein
MGKYVLVENFARRKPFHNRTARRFPPIQTRKATQESLRAASFFPFAFPPILMDSRISSR